MRQYRALVVNDLRLALRDRTVIFFNYLFPLVFFFGFGGLFHAERSAGAATLVVTSVLVIGVLGNGLFGAGMRAVADREAGILRRFKVAPISPLPILAASFAARVRWASGLLQIRAGSLVPSDHIASKSA